MKKIVLALTVIAIAVSLMGCSVSKTTTTTHTVTDANGNTTTTTTITTNQNGEVSETTTVETGTADSEEIRITLSVQNDCGVSAQELYIARSDSDEWGEERLGDLAPLNTDEVIHFNNFLLNDANDVLWDLQFVDDEGEELNFAKVNISAAENPEDVTLILWYDESDDSYNIHVQ